MLFTILLASLNLNDCFSILKLLPKRYKKVARRFKTLQWRHNGRDGVSNHQPLHCLLNPLFRLRSKKISKLRVTGFCAGNSPVTGEFPARKSSYAENVSIWWRHYGKGPPWFIKVYFFLLQAYHLMMLLLSLSFVHKEDMRIEPLVWVY